MKNFSLHLIDTNDTMIIDGDLIVSDNGTYTVVLVVIGDSIIENPETYTVQIRSDNTFDEIGPAQNFTIIDQDGKISHSLSHHNYN